MYLGSKINAGNRHSHQYIPHHRHDYYCNSRHQIISITIALIVIWLLLKLVQPLSKQDSGFFILARLRNHASVFFKTSVVVEKVVIVEEVVVIVVKVAVIVVNVVILSLTETQHHLEPLTLLLSYLHACLTQPVKAPHYIHYLSI